ncbi:hypothetical protein Rctr197k_029 [Virus Rctr197k]|nr:hypothetical protein Rctr197k_029 [Virus Rctr197k]
MTDGNGSNGNGNNGGSGGSGSGDERVLVEPFNYISTNIKGRSEHALTSRCVAFVGRNRRGKTAQLDAIRLALTGKHPVGPHGSDLFELAPENALTLFASLRGPNTSTAFTVEVEGGKPRKPPEKPDRTGALKTIEGLSGSDKLFENMLPTLSMRDLVKGATLTREAVFKRFGNITSLPTPRGLNKEQLTLWEKARDEVQQAKTQDTAEVLSGMSAFFRKSKLEKGREIKALEKLLKEREAALVPAAAGSEELPKLKKDLADAEAWERAADVRARKVEIDTSVAAYRVKVEPYIKAEERRPQHEAETAEQDRARAATIADLTNQIETLEGQVRHAEADFEQAVAHATLESDAERGKVDGEYATRLEEELEYLQGGNWLVKCLHVMEDKRDAEGNAPCVLCGGPVNLADLTAAIKPRVEARRKSVESLKAEREKALAKIEKAKFAAVAKLAQAHEKELARLEKEKMKLEALRTTATTEHQRWKEELVAKKQTEEEAKNLLKQEYERIRAARDENQRALVDVPESYEGQTAAELKARIKALEDAETASRQLDAEVAKLRQLGSDQDLYKLLETEAARELNVLLTRTAETANATVNKYMPEGFRAQLDIESAQWTVVGMDNRPHKRKAMAGSEFGALVPALAEAWTEDAPARYVLLDDEDLAFFDTENLALLLQSLKDACDDGLLTQVFIAWSRPHEIPDGWGQKIYIDAPATTFAAPPPPVAGTATASSGATLLL